MGSACVIACDVENVCSQYDGNWFADHVGSSPCSCLLWGAPGMRWSASMSTIDFHNFCVPPTLNSWPCITAPPALTRPGLGCGVGAPVGSSSHVGAAVGVPGGVVEVALQQISRQGTGCRTGASLAAHRTARRHFSIGLAPLGGVSTSVRGAPQFLQAAVIVSAACIYSAIRAGSWF